MFNYPGFGSKEVQLIEKITFSQLRRLSVSSDKKTVGLGATY